MQRPAWYASRRHRRRSARLSEECEPLTPSHTRGPGVGATTLAIVSGMAEATFDQGRRLRIWFDAHVTTKLFSESQVSPQRGSPVSRLNLDEHGLAPRLLPIGVSCNRTIKHRQGLNGSPRLDQNRGEPHA